MGCKVVAVAHGVAKAKLLEHMRADVVLDSEALAARGVKLDKAVRHAVKQGAVTWVTTCFLECQSVVVLVHCSMHVPCTCVQHYHRPSLTSVDQHSQASTSCSTLWADPRPPSHYAAVAGVRRSLWLGLPLAPYPPCRSTSPSSKTSPSTASTGGRTWLATLRCCGGACHSCWAGLRMAPSPCTCPTGTTTDYFAVCNKSLFFAA